MFSHIDIVLKPDGYLYVETFGGHGKNYLQLPGAGKVKAVLQESYEIISYVERRVGPAQADAVSVRLLARKRGREATLSCG
jgi:hypothetical protein